MEKEMMSNGKKLKHCLVLSYPAVGHINPLLQFSKRLQTKGLKATLVITESIRRTIDLSAVSVAVETISDGYDDGGVNAAPNPAAYLERFARVGTSTLTDLVQKLLSGSGGRDELVDCVVVDAFLPWGVGVAERFGLVGALFLTQACAVNELYYQAWKGSLRYPVGDDTVVSIPELGQLTASDFPSFLSDPGAEPGWVKMVVDQFSVVEEAPWVLCNTYYELEPELVNWMMKKMRLKTIGPLIPSMYLDKRIEGDNQYGITLSNPNFESCMNWLNSQPKRSVAYVSFGSLVQVKAEQMKEVALGLTRSGCRFLWVVRTSEAEKLPKGFAEETKDTGLVVSWCPQLEVLKNESVGCFVTHCGWNSTLEALSLGVPMVTIPQWSDQSTNAKYIVDVWKVGVRGEKDENGIVRAEILEKCLRDIIDGDKGKELRDNSEKLSEFAKKAMGEGGSSDKNIDEFIANMS